MKREEIEQKYKWSIEDIYQNSEEFEKDFNEVKDKIKDIEKYKDTFLNLIHL